MSKKMLVNAAQQGEVRVGVVEDGILGDVTAVEPSGRVALRGEGVRLEPAGTWSTDV